ncbi:MAG: GNAT family N-acetyltransferase [Chloroflexi bacterium]|nr:MAG: GNAT family N-acetyltransferase [Chloroflexota bacterium]
MGKGRFAAHPPAPVYEYRRAGFSVSTDPERLDLDVIHGFLCHSYWSPGIPREAVAAAVRNSLCFGLYAQQEQIGFARVVTDYVTVAYLADVFVLSNYRGQGLATWLVNCVMECPCLQPIRNFLLATRDAHGLYEKVGFEGLSNPERWMIRRQTPAWHQPDLIVET